jgi:hypothetical protein
MSLAAQTANIAEAYRPTLYFAVIYGVLRRRNFPCRDLTNCKLRHADI